MRMHPWPLLVIPVLAASGLAAAQTAENEDIYVFRSHLVSNIAAGNGTTPGCAATEFPVRLEREYSFATLATDPQTGLVTDADIAPAPGFTTCVGLIDEDGGFDMEARGHVADTDYTMLMRCEVHGTDMPVAGLALLSCHGRLEDLDPKYSGGHMTSTTMPTMNSGPDLPGYVSTSIITVRLWRAPR